MSLKWDHLTGRPFVWGHQDCLSLFRDFYSDNFSIEITNYARPTNWSSDNLDLMRLCYEREGFEMILDWKAADLRPADVLCMSIGNGAANHFSIFAGDNLLVHHLYGRFSNDEPYRDFWRNLTAFVLRHPDIPDLRPVYPDVDIGTLLLDRYKVQTPLEA